MRGILALSFCLMLSGPALADTFDGVFASQPEGCVWLQKEGAQALFEHDFLAMTLADGIQANEFFCDFLDTKSTKDGSALVITAFCMYPGEPFPDLISLSQFDDNSILAVSLHRMQEDAALGVEGIWGSQTYTRCTDLKELPR